MKGKRMLSFVITVYLLELREIHKFKYCYYYMLLQRKHTKIYFVISVLIAEQ